MELHSGAPRIDPPTDPRGCFWYTVAFVVFSAVVITIYNWLKFPGR